MHPALWKLMRMRVAGVLRRFYRSLNTVQGFAFLLLGIGMLGLWLAPVLLFPIVDHPLFRITPEMIESLVPPAVLGACLLTVILGEDKALRFGAAEMDFLFTAPLTRLDLMVYKLVENTFGAALAGLFFFVWLVPHVPNAFAAFWGCFQALLFVQLFQIAFVLLGQTVTAQIQTLNRVWVTLGVVAVVGALIGPAIYLVQSPDVGQGWQRFQETWIGFVMTFPLEYFGHTMTADGWYELAAWGGGAAAVNLVVMSVIIRLDRYYLDAALASSQRFLAMVQRVQSGGLLAVWGSPLRWKLPQIPRLSGTGPIIWRQANHAARSLPTLLSVAATVLFAVAAPRFLSATSTLQYGDVTNIVIAAAAFQLTFLFTMMLRFDFRNDLQQMDLLKTLPIRPTAVAIGELVVPVAIATFVQATLILGIAVSMDGPEMRNVLLIAITLTLPLNFLLFGLENFLFLVYPSRSIAFNPGDLQGIGRQIVLFITKMFLLFVLGLCALMVGVFLFFQTRSVALAAFSIWLMLGLFAVLTIPLMAWAFARFDPSFHQHAE